MKQRKRRRPGSSVVTRRKPARAIIRLFGILRPLRVAAAPRILRQWLLFSAALSTKYVTQNKTSRRPRFGGTHEENEVKKGGIIIPDTAKEKPTEGVVRAVGPGKRDDDGKVTPIEVREGDRVLMTKYGGTEVKLDGKEYERLRRKAMEASHHTLRSR